jgi:hypothetical protein
MTAERGRWRTRRVIFNNGVLLMLFSALTVPIVIYYTRRHVEVLNIERTAEMLYSSHSESWAVAGFWADTLALILVTFGRGWSRIGALSLGSLILIWIVASI